MTKHHPARRRPSGRRAVALATATLAVLSLCSCAQRYYSATVFGYIREDKTGTDGTQAGINGAQVLVFLEDPELDAAAEPSVRTSSMTSGGEDGYWNHKVMWSTRDPAFSDEGDSGTIWVRIMCEGYFPVTTEVPGILSDASNAVPTIELTAIVTTALTGRVINENGAGVDGVQVVLDLETTAEEADYTTTTATDGNIVGVFSFANIAWEDADSVPTQDRSITDGVATENVRLYIDDTAYYSDTHALRYKDAQTAVAISSGVELDITDAPITVRSATFTVPILKGRVVSVASATTGLNGVTVALDLPLTAASPDATVVTATLGGEAGWYQFEEVSWTNVAPTHSADGEYDDTVTARVYLADGSWYSDSDADDPLELDVTSGQNASPGTHIAAGDATFSVPSVTGRVLLDGTSTYENGVGVRIELSDGTVIGTTTTRVGTADGTFTFTDVEWVDAEPETSGGALAETEQARIYIEDADYTSEADSQSPLIVELGDGDAYALDSELTVFKRRFSVPSVTGTVETDTGDPVSGMTVILDLQSTTDTPSDLTTTTDQDGTFVFTNVSWTDDTPDDSATDTEEIDLSISDASYEVSAALPLKTLTSGVSSGTAGDPNWTITAVRTERWSYSVNVSGSCTYRYLSANPVYEDPVPGVKVTITSTDVQGGSLVTNTTPLVVQTGSDGAYAATVTWSRDPDYLPSLTARANGGDTLDVTVFFELSGYDFGAAAAVEILSWSANNIVDGVDTDP